MSFVDDGTFIVILLVTILVMSVTGLFTLSWFFYGLERPRRMIAWIMRRARGR